MPDEKNKRKPAPPTAADSLDLYKQSLNTIDYYLDPKQNYSKFNFDPDSSFNEFYLDQLKRYKNNSSEGNHIGDNLKLHKDMSLYKNLYPEWMEANNLKTGEDIRRLYEQAKKNFNKATDTKFPVYDYVTGALDFAAPAVWQDTRISPQGIFSAKGADSPGINVSLPYYDPVSMYPKSLGEVPLSGTKASDKMLSALRVTREDLVKAKSKAKSKPKSYSDAYKSVDKNMYPTQESFEYAAKVWKKERRKVSPEEIQEFVLGSGKEKPPVEETKKTEEPKSDSSNITIPRIQKKEELTRQIPNTEWKQLPDGTYYKDTKAGNKAEVVPGNLFNFGGNTKNVPQNIPTWNYPSSDTPIHETNSAPNMNFFGAGGNVEGEPEKTNNEVFSEKEFIKYMVSEGITDPRAQANILAQLKAESNFIPKSEKLNYSPERLYEIFPNKFKNLEEAIKTVELGEEAVGNKLYGNRMGNAEDEGYKYRGRGLIQITGKNNYEKYGKLIGKDLVNNPDLANDPDVAKQISIAYFKGKNIDLTNPDLVNKAVGYKESSEERVKRNIITNDYYSQLGVEGLLPVDISKQENIPIATIPKDVKAKMPEIGKNKNYSVTLQTINPEQMSRDKRNKAYNEYASQHVHENVKYPSHIELAKKNEHLDKLSTAQGMPRMYGRGMRGMGRGLGHSSRRGQKHLQSQHYGFGGNTFGSNFKRAINSDEAGAVGGALYGVGAGALNAATMGTTQGITSAGQQALFDEDNQGAQTALGIGQMAGGITAGALTGNVAGAIQQGTAGAGQALGAAEDPNLQQAGAAVDQMGNMAQMGMGQPGGQMGGMMPQMGGMSFNYGGNMYGGGGPEDPEKSIGFHENPWKYVGINEGDKGYGKRVTVSPTVEGTGRGGYDLDKVHKFQSFLDNFRGKINPENAPTPNDQVTIIKDKSTGKVAFKDGGNMGYGSNNMRGIPVTQFSAGGTHEENPLGGIPQGVGQNGKMNMVEEGELKIPDPRNPETDYIISADKSMKITKQLAEELDIPKKYVGKPIKDAVEKALRKDSRREGDSIESNTTDLEILPLIEAHDVLTAEKKEEEAQEFAEKLGKLEEEYPEYMQALMGQQEPSPEEMGMEQPPMGMEQGMEQGMGMEGMSPEMGMDPMGGGMPPQEMMRYGGKTNNYSLGGGDPLGNPWNNPWQDQFGIDTGGNMSQKLAQANAKSEDPYNPHHKDPTLDDYDGNVNIDQSFGNAAMQAAPIAYNLGMGMFGKPLEMDLARIESPELDRVNFDESRRQMDRSAAGTKKGIRGSGAGAGNYLANMQGLEGKVQEGFARLGEQEANMNTQIGNQEAQLGMQAQMQNAQARHAEEANRVRELGNLRDHTATGMSQIGQVGQGNMQNQIGMAYADSDDFKTRYNPFGQRVKKGLQNNLGNKKV